MNIELRRVEKIFSMPGGHSVPALRDVNLNIASGDFVALMGPSGCGKTTLLSVIGLLSRQTHGDYLLDSRNVLALSSNELAQWRSDYIGFIFQSYNLLSKENALRNTMLPLTFRNIYRKDRKQRAVDALEAVQLAPRMRHYPSQLSGGEQQRVSIARALVNRPRLLLADEPTGNLDSQTGAEIMALIREVATRYSSTVIIATHDKSVADYAPRIIHMKDGKIISDESRK